MSNKVQSGNKTHDDACAVAAATQAAVLATPGISQATAKAADIAYYRTCRTSALANACGAGPFIRALQELGQGGQ